MNKKKFFCKTLLQGKQWRNDVILSLDPEGIITGIEQGLEPDANESISGIVVPGMPNVHSHAFQRAIAGRTGPKGMHQDSFLISLQQSLPVYSLKCSKQVTRLVRSFIMFIIKRMAALIPILQR